jgi:hypothetical protein
MLSALREWKTVQESEANLREAWQILGQVTSEPPKKANDLCLDLAQYHIQGWCRSEPEACAACLDEATLRFLPDAGPDALRAWNFVAPFFEEDFVAAVAKLPPERRAAFRQKREST